MRTSVGLATKMFNGNESELLILIRTPLIGEILQTLFFSPLVFYCAYRPPDINAHTNRFQHPGLVPRLFPLYGISSFLLLQTSCSKVEICQCG